MKGKYSYQNIYEAPTKKMLTMLFFVVMTVVMTNIFFIHVKADGQEQYKITFASVEGYLTSESEDSVQVVDYINAGSYVSYPSTLSLNSEGYRPGYLITGWKIQGGDDTVYTDGRNNYAGSNSVNLYSYHPTGDTVFIAQWAESCNVTYESASGYINQDKKTTSCVKKVLKGSTINYNYPSMGNHDKVAFNGWRIKNSDGTLGDTLYSNANAMFYDGIGNYTPDSDVTFVAEWVEAYTITFESSGGYISGNESSTTQVFNVKKGNNVSGSPSISNRAGYVFIGWKVKDGNDTIYASSYDGSGRPTLYEYYPSGDTTFVDVWKEAVTVRFHSDEGYMPGGMGASSTDYNLNVVKGDGITANLSISRPGYFLIGWKLDGGDDTIYANGTVYLDANINPTPTQISDTCLGGFKPTKNVKFIAVWKVAQAVTFKSSKGYIDGNPNTTEKTIQVADGYKIGDAPVGYYSQGNFFVNGCEDYGLSGWKTEGDDTLYRPYSTYASSGKNITDYVVTGDVTFEAQWESDKTVTFNSGEGSFLDNTKSKEYSIKGGSAVFELGYTVCNEMNTYMNGKVLVGWTVKGDETKKVYYMSRDGADNIWDYYPENGTTFVAFWEDAWKVTYRTDVGYIHEDEEIRNESYWVAKGQKINSDLEAAYPYNLTCDGYKFLGWKIEGDDTLYEHADYDEIEDAYSVEHEIYDYVPTGDVTFVAQWKKDGEPAEPVPVTPDPTEDKKDTSSSEQPTGKQPESVIRQQTTITAKSYTKTYGVKAFNIGVQSNSDGVLKYTSSNNKVAKISADGKVSITGCGKTDIIIEVPETDGFEAASRTVTITVLPGAIEFKKVTSPKSSQIYFSWKKMEGVSKYQFCVSGNKKFKNAKKYSTKGTSVKLAPKTSGVSASGRSFYIRVRAVSKIGKKTYYGKWSKTKRVKVK